MVTGTFGGIVSIVFIYFLSGRGCNVNTLAPQLKGLTITIQKNGKELKKNFQCH